MFLKTTCITASTLALCTVANADIVYSGELADIVSDTGEGGSMTVDIAGYSYEFGILVGGPLDYSYVTTTSENAGLFVPLTETDEARNFSAGDNIGTFTSVLNMYPLGGGDENINLVMHDYAGTLESKPAVAPDKERNHRWHGDRRDGISQVVLSRNPGDELSSGWVQGSPSGASVSVHHVGIAPGCGSVDHRTP